jgi:hypothetical protein
MLCLKCPKRENCSELCPKAEKYVSRDYKSQRETLWAKEKLAKIPDLDKIPDSDKHKYGLDPSQLTLADLQVRFSGEINLSYLTREQNKILTADRCDGLKDWEIARNLKIDKHRVKNQKYSAKQKILEEYSKGEGENR